MTNIVFRSVVGSFLASSIISAVIAAQHTREAEMEYLHAEADTMPTPPSVVGACADSETEYVALGHISDSSTGLGAAQRSPVDACITAPINNDYAASLNAFRGRTRFTLHLATRGSEGQDATSCWSSGGVDQDVWYTFQADEIGMWTVSLCASEAKFDSRVVVYEYDGSGPPTAEVACDDDACGNGEPGSYSSVSFYAEVGQIFSIQVGAVDSPGTADVVMDITVE